MDDFERAYQLYTQANNALLRLHLPSEKDRVRSVIYAAEKAMLTALESAASQLTTAPTTPTADTGISHLVVAEESTSPKTPASPHLPGDQIEALFTHAAQCYDCAVLLVSKLSLCGILVADADGPRLSSTFQRLPSKPSAETSAPASVRSPSKSTSNSEPVYGTWGMLPPEADACEGGSA